MAQLSSIYTIQASDAPQRTGELQDILQKLQSENRIRDFKIVDEKQDFSSFSNKLGEEDMVILVLPHQLEPQKEEIENRLKVLKTNHQEVKIAELLLDNVVYENSFLIFPTDLRPIQIREDENSAWANIEENLKDIFPSQESDEPAHEKVDWRYRLKAAGIFAGFAILCFALLFFLTVWLIEGGDWNEDDVIILYIVLLALTAAFFITKKNFWKKNQESYKPDE